jgi:pyruvate formate lyase activating enzyme
VAASITLKKLIALRKTSLVDYPGLISAGIFFPGCNLRCPWCHNRELVLGNADYSQEDGINANADYITLEAALGHLKKRRKVLGGTVLSGGEPTLFPGLGELIEQIKTLGLKVKLDTNGLLPDALETLFNAEKTRPVYIAMDLKTSPERYSELVPENVSGTADPGEAIKHSSALIRASGISHEFRSLALPFGSTALSPRPNNKQKPYFDEQDKAALAALAGDSPWHIRPFVPGNCLDPAWNNI